MKVLFTGEQGQLARKISELLIENGDQVVEVHDNWKVKVSRHHPWPELDVTDEIAMSCVFHDAKPDVVVHSAAVVNTDKCAADPKRSMNVNLMGTHNVIKACTEYGAKLLYFSTTATYDPTEPRPFTELTRQRAPTMYGITKYAGEMLVTGQKEVPHMIVRPCFVYGDPPFDHSSQICRVAVHEALRQLWPEKAGPTLSVTLDAAATKDYMRIEDFAQAVVKILQLDAWNGEVFNVSNQKARPMGEYFDLMAYAMGIKRSELNMRWLPEADYMGDHVVSSQKLRACTGWTPRIGIERGIAMTANAALKYVADCRDGKNTLLYQ